MNNWRELSRTNVFAIRFGNLLVRVTDNHIRHCGQWIMDCPPYFHEKELKAKTKEQALEEAVGLVHKQVKRTMDDLLLGHNQ